MDLKLIKQAVIIASLIILFLNVRITQSAMLNQYPPEDEFYTSIILSMLPASILFLSITFLVKDDSKLFKTMLGVISTVYAWEFIADPFSISLRMDSGFSLLPIILYTIIGTVFLLIAVLCFRRVE